MGRIGVDDLEDLSSLRLDGASQEALLQTATECTFVFKSESGWPAGVVMSYLPHDGGYWLTAVSTRAQARAVASDPRVTLVMTNAGTVLPGRQMLAIRGVAVVHRDEETKRWFYPAFAARLARLDPAAFVRLLDSENRVIIEVRPVGVSASHDSRRMPGDGRGGVPPNERGQSA
jgi:hypothetical protein